MLCAAVGITTYMLTKNRLDENIKDLTKQVNRSMDVERRANVVQRVSRQIQERLSRPVQMRCQMPRYQQECSSQL